MTADDNINTIQPSFHKFNVHNDERGTLSVQDFSDLPVIFVRLFIIKSFDITLSRGGHAHKNCWQFLFTSTEGINLTIENKNFATAFELQTNVGVLIPPYNWLEIVFKNKMASLCVLASEKYDPEDYIYLRPEKL